MNGPQRESRVVLSWWQRVVLIAAGTALVGLLATAAALRPDPRGSGTHQQLGLPPCTFRQVTGIRCPSCGMTTAWSHLMRGQLLRSFRANAGGALLAVTALCLAPWALVSGLRGRWLWGPIGERVVVGLVVLLLAVTLLDWSIRCFVLR